MISYIINEEIGMLNEGLSKILYHFTYVSNLINILRLNKFATSSNIGSIADRWKDKGKFYFFSTQRTKGMSGYGNNHGDVAIVLNGEKLNQNFKGFPTDYWNWSKKRSAYSDKSGYYSALQSEENEDRIVTDKPYIDNAIDYIIEIHIFVNDYLNNVQLKQIVDLSNNLNIPVYFYKDQNSFKLQNKANAIPPDSLDVIEKDTENDISYNERLIYDTKWFFKDISPILIVDNIKNEDTIETLLIKFLYDTYGEGNYDQQYTNLMEDINKKVKGLSNRWVYADDAYHSLSADIHNARGNPNTYFREILRLLVNDMKRLKVNNLKEYVESKLNVKIR
jgi:hypothetical protein